MSKFADDTKLCGSINSLEGRDAIQRNVWEVDPCEHLEVQHGRDDFSRKYKLGGEWIGSSSEEKDWGMLVDKMLDMTT